MIPVVVGANHHLLAQRLFTRPDLGRERFVDHRDPRRRRTIGIVEIAAADEREFQRSEDAGLDDVPVGLKGLATWRGLSWNREAADSHASAIERQIDR